MPGIISSRIGHLGGNEIVEVEYDSAQTNLEQMAGALKREQSFYSVVVNDKEGARRAGEILKKDEIRVDSNVPHFVESKHSLRVQHPDLYYLDLTEQQAIALNSWSYFGGKMPAVLTPGQNELRSQLAAKFSRKVPSSLKPARPGQAREDYRAQLLEWLRD